MLRRHSQSHRDVRTGIFWRPSASAAVQRQVSVDVRGVTGSNVLCSVRLSPTKTLQCERNQ